jgi:hypothetical protein
MSPRHFANRDRNAAYKRHQDNVDLFVGFTTLIGLGKYFSNTPPDFDYDPAEKAGDLSNPDIQSHM